MRWSFTLICLTLVFATVVTAAAREGRPGADEAPLPDGVSFEHLAQMHPEQALPEPAVVALMRITLDPGAILPIAADDAYALIEVESGTWILSTPAWVSSAVVNGTPVTEVSVDRVELPLPEGQGTTIPPLFGGEIRNEGPAPAIAIMVLLQPDLTEAGSGATPDSVRFGSGVAGVTVQHLASGRAETMPDRFADLVIGRLTLELGAVIPLHHQCGGQVGVVESGTLEIRAVEGAPLEVIRARGQETPATGFGAAVEVLAPGSATTLAAGDGVFVPTGSTCEVRTTGDQPAVILVAFIDPP
jgi:hypothetical protein